MFLKKSLGQNFLRDKNILAKEAKLLGVQGKTILEIGSGDGRLTEQLLLAGAKKVIAIEKDPKMVELLKSRFISDPVEIVAADFLEIDPKSFRIDKIAGNIPYYISSPIIFKLKEFDFQDAILMVQEEFAKKMVEKPGSSGFGRLSVTSQLFYEVKYIQKVPAHLFDPPPKVNSAIIQLKNREINLTQSSEDTIRALFSHKNKTVRNALIDAGLEKEKIQPLGSYLLKRPRELKLEEIIAICKILDK